GKCLPEVRQWRCRPPFGPVNLDQLYPEAAETEHHQVIVQEEDGLLPGPCPGSDRRVMFSQARHVDLQGSGELPLERLDGAELDWLTLFILLHLDQDDLRRGANQGTEWLACGQRYLAVRGLCLSGAVANQEQEQEQEQGASQWHGCLSFGANLG